MPSDTATAPEATKTPERTFSPVTRTVFDLESFSDVKLTKPFNAPEKPETVEQAIALVGNDTSKLLDLIYEGLVSESRNAQYEQIDGFLVVPEEGEASELYQREIPILDADGNPVLDESGQPKTRTTGKYADEKKSKVINNAVLNLAKAFSGGMWDSAKKEQKDAWKASAVSMMRSNPAMLQSLQG